MRLVIFLLTLGSLSLSASTYSQTVTLRGEQLTMEQIFRAIQQQTGYRVAGKRALIQQARPVTVQAEQMPLNQFLDEVFHDQSLTYNLVDNNIIIREAPRTAKLPVGGERSSLEATLILAYPEVRGRVVDSLGNPLSGASVRVLDAQGRRTVLQTTTHLDGSFTLNDVPENAKLEITYVGYLSTTVPASDNLGNIRLKAMTSMLDETLVIAYGTTTRRLSTGSVGTLKASDIEKQPVANPLAALQGRIAGLDISATNGAPGSAMKVRIRGTNSLTNGSDPLFIIDGVPFAPGNENVNQQSSIASRSTPVNYIRTSQTEIAFGSTLITSGLSPFQLINPADIESIEVLRDADATAIYGSRGANGVILITTRKGGAGKTSLNAQVYTGASRVTRFWKMMNTQEYVQMRKEAFANDAREMTLANAYDILVWDTTAYTDWQHLLIGGTARTTDANVRLSGGNEYTQFMIGSGFRRETNVFPGDHANVRGSLQTQMRNTSRNQRLRTELRLNYTVNENESVGSISGIDLPPNAPGPYDENGKLFWGPQGAEYTNPMAGLMNSANMEMESVMANLQISYRLATGLDFRASVGHNRIQTQENSISPVAAKNPYYVSTGSFSLSNGNMKSWIVEPQLEYTLQFRDMKWIALAGATWQSNENKSSSVYGSGYTDDSFINALRAAGGITGSNTDVDYKYLAAFGRLSWQWKERYLLNFSGRRDGSSRFGPGRRFNNFGAIGAGWIFSDEPFFQNLSKVITYGKLRGSYGVTGSDQIGDYMYLNTWSLTNTIGNGLQGLLPDALFNDTFNWERNRKIEGGLELAFFNDRLVTSVNHYVNRSGNQLIRYNLSGQTGFTGIMQNFPALIQNSGWEFEINAKPGLKNLNWTTSANLSIPKNKLVSFPGIEKSSYANAFVIGESVNLIRAYLIDGIDPQTGVYRRRDINGDGRYTTTGDYAVIGSRDPALLGGWNNSFSYKGVALDVFFEFKKMFGYNYYYASAYAGNLQNRLAVITDRWRKPGDEGVLFQRYTANPGAAYTEAGALQSSELAYGDNSYLRLKSMMIAYNLPLSPKGKQQTTHFKIFIQGFNLYTWNRHRDMDPEAPINSIGIPPLRTITAGINISL